MAYEYPTAIGVLRLLRMRQRWTVEFKGRRCGQWPSPDAAAKAVAHRKSGLTEWDRKWSDDVSDNLLDWRPLDDSL